MTNFERASGIILHPTSLPNKYGIGDLGQSAYDWINYLKGAKQKLWQILPLGPTGYGDSPYQSFSAFAGNFYLVSPELLLKEGLLTTADVADLPDFPTDTVDYGWAIWYKLQLLDRAYANFKSSRKRKIKAEFAAFCEAQAEWLTDFALFMALKEEHDGAVWSTWSADLVAREPQALAAAHQRLKTQVEAQQFRQWLFFRQWNAVKTAAHDVGLKIIGDIPIFVAYDSADVWQRPELFQLQANGQPTAVAGVPPDYFSPTGQLWGNPLYDWDAHAAENYAWWIKRIQATLETVDMIRIDHFRGFDEYWAVPATSETAEIGEWRAGPREGLFDAINAALGDLPIIAEDLGLVTPGVIALRDHFELPGMKILQFAFGGDADDAFLPHMYPENCVAYSGTHDNDTSRGWYETSSLESERANYRNYFNVNGADVAWDFMKAIWNSKAVMTLAPMQDVLNLDTQSRMNFPGKPAGNWGWRLSETDLTAATNQSGLAHITEQAGRD